MNTDISKVPISLKDFVLKSESYHPGSFENMLMFHRANHDLFHELLNLKPKKCSKKEILGAVISYLKENKMIDILDVDLYKEYRDLLSPQIISQIKALNNNNVVCNAIFSKKCDSIKELNADLYELIEMRRVDNNYNKVPIDVEEIKRVVLDNRELLLDFRDNHYKVYIKLVKALLHKSDLGGNDCIDLLEVLGFEKKHVVVEMNKKMYSLKKHFEYKQSVFYKMFESDGDKVFDFFKDTGVYEYKAFKEEFIPHLLNTIMMNAIVNIKKDVVNGFKDTLVLVNKILTESNGELLKQFEKYSFSVDKIDAPLLSDKLQQRFINKMYLYHQKPVAQSDCTNQPDILLRALLKGIRSYIPPNTLECKKAVERTVLSYQFYIEHKILNSVIDGSDILQKKNHIKI